MLHTIDLTQWVSMLGYLGVLSVIFLETGLFLGFFLPGDSLLFTAGLLASQGLFNIWLLVSLVFIVAIAGYFLSYWYGEKFGFWLLKREDSLFFKKRYLLQAKAFYEKHGGKALILGRLMPIVRTFVPVVAGMAQMPYRRYVIFNIVGAVIWVGGVTLGGFYLGQIIPNAERYLLPIVLLIILISVAPGLWHFIKSRRATRI
ncbi:MAG: hypothetical protein A3F41_06675 [Coxiella sp. RIFCSPHIGHO2_12_FULL_44_14]|nr:MAG: hypothetical protein A3F41_06675 [Coxiella sp. RIFCSPHIGHO2_12_FULL_44_14]